MWPWPYELKTELRINFIILGTISKYLTSEISKLPPQNVLYNLQKLKSKNETA